MDVGVLTAYGRNSDLSRLRSFAARITARVQAELESATGVPWVFHPADPIHLTSDDARRPSDFLDEAALQMVDGPYDLVLVVTDAPLQSPARGLVPGLASPAAGMAVVSARRLVTTPRGEAARALEEDVVTINAATLLLHLIGHLLLLPHGRDAEDPMSPFRFDPHRRRLPAFGPAARRRLRDRCRRFPEPLVEGGFPHRFWFHAVTAARHPGTLLSVLARNRAPLLPLALPSLATAAVAPTFLLVFTAEIWDAGLNMPNGVVALFASGAIVGAAWYLTAVQDLFFPREEKRRVTQRTALVNVVILATVVVALVGLFAMVALLMLFVATSIFPPGLIATWPTLEDPEVSLADKLRLAAFISVIGTLTGALAGGLESRAVVRHLALFLRDP